MITSRMSFLRRATVLLSLWLVSTACACIPLDRSLLETEEFSVSVSVSFSEAPEFEIEIEKMPLPAYPSDLMSAGVSGKAVMELVITSAGEVEDVKALRSSHEQFQEAALQAVKQWKFRIGDKDRDTPAKARVEFRFRMTEKQPN